MSKVRSKDTNPELLVRRLVFKMGYRYRLHQADLPGQPDIVFRKRKKTIFINGCFWHKHSDPNCTLARLPKSRLSYWGPKLESNKIRDEKNISKLIRDGWDILVIWECQLKDMIAIESKILALLENDRN